MSAVPLLLIDGYALPVIVRCYTEAHGRGLAGAVGICAMPGRRGTRARPELDGMVMSRDDIPSNSQATRRQQAGQGSGSHCPHAKPGWYLSGRLRPATLCYGL